MSLTTLSQSKIIRELYHLSSAMGIQSFLVGGMIRDLLLGKPLGKDFDFVCPWPVEGLAKELAKRLRGQAFLMNDSFGTWRVVIKKGKIRIKVDFSPLQGDNILDDLRQRDFTVNSIALPTKDFLRPTRRSLIDPLGGVSDLRIKSLRTNSEDSLIQDPVRMLRAFRLSHTRGLSIEGKTLEMIRRNKEQIRRCSWERIRQEFFATLDEPRCGIFLRHIHELSMLQEIFPEIKGWEGLFVSPGYSLLDHALKAVAAADFILTHSEQVLGRSLGVHFSEVVEEGISRRALFKFLVFFHDSGKPKTQTNGQGEPSFRFLDHDQEGQKINAHIGRRLKLSRRSTNFLSELTRQHMRLMGLSKAQEWTDRAKYRFFRDLGKEGIDALCLALANGLAKKDLAFAEVQMDSLPEDIQRIRRIGVEFLRYYDEEFSVNPPGPLMSGKEIMERFHLPQGKEVGWLLERLREAELTGTVRGRKDALEYLQSEYAKNIDKFHRLG